MIMSLRMSRSKGNGGKRLIYTKCLAFRQGLTSETKVLGSKIFYRRDWRIVSCLQGEDA